MSTVPTLPELSARVAKIDGVNLPKPLESDLKKIWFKINELQTTIRSVTLTLESQLEVLIEQINNVSIAIGQPGPTGATGPAGPTGPTGS